MLWDMKQSSHWMVGVCLLLLIVGRPVRLWAETKQTSQRSTPSQRGRVRRVGGAANLPGRTASPARITLKDGLLSVDVREQDLRTMVESIAAQGDIDVRHAEGLPEKRVSLRFDAMPLVEGLKRLFRVADLPGYALITEGQGEQTKVQRIVFLAVQEGMSDSRSSSRSLRPAPSTRTRSARTVTRPTRPGGKASEDDMSGNQSVFADIKRNTTARRLLSQLVHPNEQVRERALERLIRLVGDDEKQAELLDYLEPLMEQLASEDKEDRDNARADIRKLLRR